jgi:hypothetical protein
VAEQDRHNLHKLSPLGARHTEVPPEPTPVDPAEAADVAEAPHHTSKALSASVRFLGTVAAGMIAAPAAAEVVQSQTPTVDTSLDLTLSQVVQLQATADISATGAGRRSLRT